MLATTARSLGAALLALGTLSCSGNDGKPGPRGPAGPEGPAGTTGNAGGPSVSAVVPRTAFLGRSEELTISGFATSWNDGVVVDIGDGVTVDSVAVASPTALLVDVTVSADAAPGVRDLTVTQQADTLTYAGAFAVESPVLASAQGNLAQGSAAVLTMKNLDFRTPFDTTSTGGTLFDPNVTYPNVHVAVPDGFAAQIASVEPYGLDFVLFLDVDAPPGSHDVEIESGPMAAVDRFRAPGAFDVEARTPNDLVPGTSATGSISSPFDSAVYSLAPGNGLKLVTVDVGSNSPDANPSAFILPPSGKFTDALGFSAQSTFVASSNDPYFVVYWDNTGTNGYTYVLLATSVDAEGVSEAEPNDSAGNAQNATTLPFVLRNASLASGTDEDWIVLTASAADVGKSVRVRTVGSDAQTDVVVDVLQSDATTSLGGPSNDAGFHEDFTSDAIPSGGTYYVRVFASPFFDPAHDAYEAIVTIE